MALKDHAVFFVVAACTATAAITWTVSEQLRVAPLKSKLEAQEISHKSSPMIEAITVTKTKSSNSEIAEQNIEFSDPEGDAIFINYIVLRTDAKEINVSTTTINVPKEEQVQGATTLGRWTCGTKKYFVRFRVILTDARGHLSLPYDHVVNCNF